MKTHLAKLLPICLLIIAISCAKTSNVTADDGGALELTEFITVIVNCTTANVYTNNMVMSANTTLIHFPASVDMSDADLEDATIIGLAFSTAQSFLIYVFNNTAQSTAESIADAMTPSINTDFDTTFTYSTTGTHETYVNITYIGPGKSALSTYTDWLIDQCLISDLEGFSQAFSSMADEPNAIVGVNALKDSGGFDWTYTMMTTYDTGFPIGSGDHLIDILDLVDASSLAPSQYAYDGSMYTSMVTVNVLSDETVSYVSSEPGEATPPDRGWFLLPLPPSETLTAYFYFGDDSSPQTPLTLTFSGNVVPEFATLTILGIFLLAATFALVARKRLQTKLG